MFVMEWTFKKESRDLYGHIVEDFDTIKKMINKNTGMKAYTCGKKYEGVVSGSGHLWKLAGVKTYKLISKQLVSDIKEYKKHSFQLQKKTRRKVCFSRNCKQSR